MLEIIGVLTLMLMISVGAFVLIRNGTAAQKRNAVMDEVSKIVTGVRTLYADYDTFPKNFSSDSTMAAMAIDTNSAIDGATYRIQATVASSLFEVAIDGLKEKDFMVLEARTWPGAVEVGGKCEEGKDVCFLFILYEK